MGLHLVGGHGTIFRVVTSYLNSRNKENMTAKKEQLEPCIDLLTPRKIATWIMEDGIEQEHDMEESNVEIWIKEYAKQKCKEQRLLCYENENSAGLYETQEGYDEACKDSIINAPEPKF